MGLVWRPQRGAKQAEDDWLAGIEAGMCSEPRPKQRPMSYLLYLTLLLTPTNLRKQALNLFTLL